MGEQIETWLLMCSLFEFPNVALIIFKKMLGYKRHSETRVKMKPKPCILEDYPWIQLGQGYLHIAETRVERSNILVDETIKREMCFLAFFWFDPWFLTERLYDDDNFNKAKLNS